MNYRIKEWPGQLEPWEVHPDSELPINEGIKDE